MQVLIKKIFIAMICFVCVHNAFAEEINDIEPLQLAEEFEIQANDYSENQEDEFSRSGSFNVFEPAPPLVRSQCWYSYTLDGKSWVILHGYGEVINTYPISVGENFVKLRFEFLKSLGICYPAR